MISYKYKCIFIYIPKCAGTSIEHKLGHLNKHSGHGGQDHRSIRTVRRPYISLNSFSSKKNSKDALRRIWYKHFATMQNSKNKHFVSKRQYKSYFKFTFVRNPWARAYSWYRGVMRDPVMLELSGLKNTIPFDEFLKLRAGKGLMRPQLYWIINCKGQIAMDFIGRFENLTEDFKQVCNILNIPNRSLPHKLKGNNTDYRNAYSKYSKKLIADIYKEDIDYFEYSFDR